MYFPIAPVAPNTKILLGSSVLTAMLLIDSKLSKTAMFKIYVVMVLVHVGRMPWRSSGAIADAHLAWRARTSNEVFNSHDIAETAYAPVEMMLYAINQLKITYVIHHHDSIAINSLAIHAHISAVHMNSMANQCCCMSVKSSSLSSYCDRVAVVTTGPLLP
jgi:hypothetical protein